LTQSPLYKGQLKPVRAWIQGTVLDVASNYGRFSALTRTAVSVDIEREFLARGLRTANITQAVVASALSLPFRDRTFDTVLAMGIIDHIPFVHISGFLGELIRVAKSTANIIIQVTSPYSFFALVNLKFYGEYLHSYSPFLLARQLRERGLVLLWTLSSGVFGSMDVMPRTVDAFVPWAVHLTLIFAREDAGALETGESHENS